MEITDTFYAKNRTAWRKWLEKNHDQFNELWLIYYKKHTKKPSIRYNDAVEEALCFGWIDSTVKRIDEEKYAQKFTPRRRGSNWSDTNKRRIQKLMDEGLMTAPGLKAIENVDLTVAPYSKSGSKELTIPEYIIEAIATNNKAFDFFQKLPPSQQKMYVYWIDSAKREETKQRRLVEGIMYLSQNKRLPMK